MFYKVEKETCGKGIKERYTIGQIIDDIEISKIKSDFNKYIYTIYEDRKNMKLEYYDKSLFNKKELIYSILLNKKINK